MPVTVVPTSLATVAMETFITELSRVMRNWAVARVSSTVPAAPLVRSLVVAMVPALRLVPGPRPGG